MGLQDPSVLLSPGNSTLGARVQVATSATLICPATTRQLLAISIRSQKDNTGYIILGPAGVTLTSGYAILYPGDTFSIDLDAGQEAVYGIASASASYVWWVGLVP